MAIVERIEIAPHARSCSTVDDQLSREPTIGFLSTIGEAAVLSAHHSPGVQE